MDGDERAEFTALLAARRAAAAESSVIRGAGMAELLSARHDDNADDEHDPEGSTLSAEWSLREGVHASQRRELSEIDAALARLSADEYGVCVVCGDDIPLRRLRARPTATTHVVCAGR